MIKPEGDVTKLVLPDQVAGLEDHTISSTSHIEECAGIVTQDCSGTWQSLHHSSAVVGHDSQFSLEGASCHQLNITPKVKVGGLLDYEGEKLRMPGRLPCLQCDATYKSKQSLKRHVKSFHENAYPVVECSYRDCKARIRSDRMPTHIYQYHSEGNRSCTVSILLFSLNFQLCKTFIFSCVRAVSNRSRPSKGILITAI